MAEYPIPDEALADHIGVLGKTGRGKSYAVQGLVEKIMYRKERTCIIDPVDRYWGLRLAGDGKKPSRFEPIIIGGNRGDMPLNPAAGAQLAGIVGSTTTPIIIVTRQLTVSDRSRFFTDFASAIVRLNEGPLHLIVDEAHLFMPQGGASVGGMAPAMLHAGNNMVSLGRGLGLRVILVSQRPAKLHKDSLSQVETLVAFGLPAPQDRRAVRDWIVENADEATGAELMSSLPSLPTGTAWIWSPQLGVLWKKPFPKIVTFDSGRPLAAAQTPALKPIDLDTLKGAMEQVAAEAIENDPRRLKRRVADLEAQLKAGPAADPAAVEQAWTDGYQQGKAEQAAEDAEAIRQRQTAIEACLRELRFFAGADVPVSVTAPPPRQRPQQAPAVETRREQRQPPSPSPAASNGAGAPLPKGEGVILIAIAQHPAGVTRPQLTQLTGYKKSSRDTYVSRLREKRHVYTAGDRIFATEFGIDALGENYEPLPTGDRLRAWWLGRIPEGERRVLQAIIARYPDAASRDEITEAVGYQKSSRDTYISRLGARELVIADRSGVRAVDELFG